MTCRQRFSAALAALALSSIVLAAAPASAQAVRLPEVQEAYDQGMKLIEEGKFSAAITSLNKAITLDRGFPEAYIAKGNALKEMELYQDAGTAYSQALDLDQNAAEAYNGRGECYMEMTPPDFNLALTDFTKALNLDRGNAAYLSNMGHVLVQSGQEPTNAIRILEEALALNDKDARAYRDRGTARAQMREFDKAVSDLKRAAELDPDDYENYSTLSTIQSRFQEDYEGAVESMGRAIEAYKPKKMGDPEAYIIGYILRADARLKVAELSEDDAAKRTAMLEGAIEDADAVLAKYEDRFPESGLALFRRGRAERMLERYTAAVNSLRKAIQIIPAGQDVEYISDAYLYRGICFYYMDMLDLARGDFEQASSTGGGFSDPRIYLWLGYTYHRQGDYRRAIDYYSEAIAKAPSFSLAHVNRGRAYMDLKEYDKAVESFSNAIRSEPDVGANYYKLGLAYIQLEEFQKAVDSLDLALRQEKPTAKMHRAMATALRGLDRDELAERHEQEAAKMEAPAPEATS